MRGNHFVKVGLIILCTIAFASLIEPLVFSSSKLDVPFSPPSISHFLGTDDLGHDVFLEILKGGRTSIIIGVVVGLASAFFGILVGAAAGYIDYLDAPLMRLVDLLLVIPRLPLMIFLALFLKPSFWNVVIILTVFGWTTTARSVRPLVKSLSKTEFVIAAQALGGNSRHILRQHILPHLYSIFAVQFVLEARQAVLAEAGLGFLGLEDPTTKSWGLMLSHAFSHEATFVTDAWMWTVLPPSILLTFFVLSLSLISVGLETVFNPKLGDSHFRVKID